MMKGNIVMLKTILKPMSKQTIATATTNFISSIPDDEQVEVNFLLEENNGTSHLTLEMIKKSKDPNINKTLKLTENNLDIKVN